MKKRIVALFLIFSIVLAVTSCSKSASSAKLTVTFIDVGQGDAALVECDGEYMLIDTGPNNKATGEKIRKLLLDNSLGTLVSASYAKYFVISVGKNNSYNHPHRETLDLIDQVLRVHNLDKAAHFFRTDENGNIVATSDGKTITVMAANQP